MARRSTIALGVAERFFLAVGVVLLGFYVLARIHGVVTLHAAIRSFEENGLQGGSGSKGKLSGFEGIDFSLWSPARIKAYKESLERPGNPPLALLRIPKLHIVAPVLDGIDDLTLNAGVGRIPGTVRPGHIGNIGIAGHRDGFFRALKDIAKGDTIELATERKTEIYVVDKAYVAEPDDVKILKAGAKPEITLVTCYPFYYIGSAPQRFIVQALKQQEKTAGAK